MKRTTGKAIMYGMEWSKTELLPKAIRHAIFTLALPSLLSGCVHPPAESPTERTAAPHPGRTVFHVGSAKVTKPLVAYTPPLPDPAPLISPSAIIENILSRKELSTESAKLLDELSKVPVPAETKVLRSSRALMMPNPKLAKKLVKLRGDSWASVRSRLILGCIEHESVNGQIEELRRHPEAVDFLMKRAAPYLRYLLEEIDRHGLPADLVLVPMVESAFETAALSTKQAAGIWQFIPSTGAQYGLQLTEAYDGRYDIHASTQAALKYLKHLHTVFNGDWLLALAAYNAGEGTVGRAVDARRKAGREGRFWDLDLPAETEAYVRKILALAHVVANPEGYGLKPYQGDDAPLHLARVEVGPEARIADVMTTTGMPQEDFYRLNPAFKPDAQPPAQTYQLLIPVDKAEVLLAGNLPGAKVFATRNVVVKKGDTLSILAKRHGVPELKLAEWNGLKPKTPLKAGQKLVVFPV